MSDILNSIFFYLHTSITTVSVKSNVQTILEFLISFKNPWICYLNDGIIGNDMIELKVIHGDEYPFFTANVNRFLDPPTWNPKSVLGFY